ncbi:MAG: DUF3102 domain-containing protein [Pirellulaceae bacterium]|nr:DUF3102 domain-containing protein [Pirellulaceae bacterium]
MSIVMDQMYSADVLRLTDEILSLYGSSNEDRLEIGARLIDLKDELKFGDFKKFVQKHFPFSFRVCNKWMQKEREIEKELDEYAKEQEKEHRLYETAKENAITEEEYLEAFADQIDHERGVLELVLMHQLGELKANVSEESYRKFVKDNQLESVASHPQFDYFTDHYTKSRVFA